MDARVAVTRFELSSRDPEVYDGWMHAAYLGYERRLWGDPEDSSFSFVGAGVDEFSVAVAHHGMCAEFATETVDGALLLNTTQSGRLRVAGGDATIETEIGRPCLMPPGRPWLVHGERFTTRAVRIDWTMLDAAAASLGREGRTVRFTGYLPRPGTDAYLSSVIDHVGDTVLNGLDSAPSLLFREAARSLAVAALLTFPNDLLDDLADPARPPVGGAEPATVRRAIEFMDAHAHEDLTVSDVAEAARVGVRGLQAAFRKHRGEAPLLYLRRARMGGAHRDLQAGDPTRGDTVGAIAARWGFVNAGRFAVEYRQIHGRSPSATLRS
jgi:AraC-like DNA-binding protein